MKSYERPQVRIVNIKCFIPLTPIKTFSQTLVLSMRYDNSVQSPQNVTKSIVMVKSPCTYVTDSCHLIKIKTLMS